MIDLGNDIEIRKDGEVVARVGISDVFEHKRELMKENYVLLSFNLDYYYRFDRGHSIVYQGEEYIIREETSPDENNIQNYTLKAKFEGLDMWFLDVIMFYPYTANEETEWGLVASPEYFLQAALDNIHKQLGDTSWKLGKIESTQTVDMSFNGTAVFDALTELAKSTECEWYLDYKEKTLNLVKKYEKGIVVELEREKNLTDVKRTNDNNEDYCTRLYPRGSTRNIPRNYRPPKEGEPVDVSAPKRLRLPLTTPGYIDAYANMKPYEIVPKVVNFDEVFPQRTGKITSIRTTQKRKDDGTYFTIFYFKDDGIKFQEKYILPGTTLMMSFQVPSKLAGRDFELGFKEGSQEYEIIVNQDNPDYFIPNDILVPQVGDPYVLYNFDIALIGDQYLPAAEQQLFEVASEWLRKTVEDSATYTCTLALAACSDDDMKLEVGQRVRLINPMFKKGYKDSRVYGFSKKQKQILYYVGDNSEYSNLGDIAGQVTANKRDADDKYVENKRKINVVNKTVKGLDYIKQALEMNTDINGGLILSALLQLGMEVNGTFKAMAGMNGLLTTPDDVFLWGGGSIDDAVKRKTPFGVLADGAGWMAGGRIAWKVTEGTSHLLSTGKYQTAETGERIEIDPETNSIRLYNEKNKIVADLSFEKTEKGISAILTVNNYNKDGLVTGSTTISGDKITMINSADIECLTIALSENKLDVRLKNIPTSREDAGNYQLYHTIDDETLKLKVIS